MFKYFIKFIAQIVFVMSSAVSAPFIMIFFMTHTLAITDEPLPPAFNSFFLIIFCSFLVLVAVFEWGKFTRDEEARSIERRINKEIHGKYEELIKYIKLAQKLTNENAEALVDEWVENRKKQEKLDDE